MKRWVLLVEPDGPTRAMVHRALTSAGYTVEDFASVRDARILLDDGAFEAAVVDELAGGDRPLDEVRYLRAAYPSVPVVVTGAMLTAPALVELLRLDVADALPKPFSPVELRDAVARAAARAVVHHGEALDYAAAVTAARRHLAAHDLAGAARALLRASRCLALDAEVTALEALRAELEGRDHDAGRGYRAALALGDDEAGEGPHPHEAIARLAAYGDARPVDALDARFADAPLWIVTDPPRELAEGPPEGTAGPVTVVMALSLAQEVGSVYLRAAGDRAFALLTSDLRAERAGALLGSLGGGALVARASSEVDLARMTEARDQSLRKERR